jgi:hypothetical protein
MKKKGFKNKLSFNRMTILELNQLAKINGGGDGGILTPKQTTSSYVPPPPPPPPKLA